jgi:uncharacterized Zn-finger protein
MATNDTFFMCNECDKTFTRENTYLYHMNVHTNPTFCPYCDKKFSGMTSNYKIHVATHTKEYNYKCKICKKTFISNTNLTQHILKTHPETINKMRDYKDYSSLPPYYKQFTVMTPIDMLVRAAEELDK